MAAQVPWPFPDFRRQAEDAHASDCHCVRCESERAMDEMGEIAVAHAADKESAMPQSLIGLPVVDAMPEAAKPRAALVGGVTSVPLDGPGMVRAAVAAAHSQTVAEIVRIRATLARMELEQGTLRSELAAASRQRAALSDWLTTDAFGAAK